MRNKSFMRNQPTESTDRESSPEEYLVNALRGEFTDDFISGLRDQLADTDNKNGKAEGVLKLEISMLVRKVVKNTWNSGGNGMKDFIKERFDPDERRGNNIEKILKYSPQINELVKTACSMDKNELNKDIILQAFIEATKKKKPLGWFRNKYRFLTE